MTRSEEIAWAAGLFEGEGNIRHWQAKGQRKRDRGLSLSSTDRDVVERFAGIVGAGQIYRVPPSKSYPGAKEAWWWQVTRWVDTERILLLLLPFLGKRRWADAQKLLADPAGATPPQTHCKRGHEFTEENTYRYKGSRTCRACRRLAAAKYKAANAAEKEVT